MSDQQKKIHHCLPCDLLRKVDSSDNPSGWSCSWFLPMEDQTTEEFPERRTKLLLWSLVSLLISSLPHAPTKSGKSSLKQLNNSFQCIINLSKSKQLFLPGESLQGRGRRDHHSPPRYWSRRNRDHTLFLSTCLRVNAFLQGEKPCWLMGSYYALPPLLLPLTLTRSWSSSEASKWEIITYPTHCACRMMLASGERENTETNQSQCSSAPGTLLLQTMD